MKKYFGIFFYFCQVNIYRSLQYKLDFIIGIIGFFITSFLEVFSVLMMFQFVPLIGGWNLHKVLMLIGYSMVVKGVDYIFSDYLWELSQNLIRSGDFSKYLIRPINPLFYLLSERFFHTESVFNILVGTLYCTISILQQSNPIVWINFIVLILLIPFSASIYFSIKLMISSISFWTTYSFPIMQSTYELSDFSRYPTTIFNDGIKFIITFIVPFALAGFYPVDFYFTTNMLNLVIVLCVSVALLTLALLLWNKGLEKYDATGT